jgi:8-oxo-dGTP pyrophosphatase MutT (NUDIX family)
LGETDSVAEILFGERIGSTATLRVGCAAVVFDAAHDKVLLTQRTDNGLWCLPGGGMDPGESASEACCREVREETGLVVEVIRLTGIYTSPDRIIRYADGNTHQTVAMCFEAKVIGGDEGLSAETIDVGWFTKADAAGLSWMSNHDERLADAWIDHPHAVIA